MKKSPPAASPDAYVAALDGWRRRCVVALRKAVRDASPLEEVVKWGHLVYVDTGPVLLIRAERDRVLFGFWRGQRLTAIERRLKPGGRYEMATLELRDGTPITAATVRRLTREAVALNRRLGDPRLAAGRKKTVLNADDFRRIALGMKGAVEAAHMGHPDFRVNGKIFATLHADHQWGMVKLTPEQQRRFMKDAPGAFAPEKGAWGLQGCTMVRLDTVDEETLGEALTLAWRNRSGKR